MYRDQSKQLGFEEMFIPFGGKLKKENRWILMSEQIPWDELGKSYERSFSHARGAPSLPFRTALGAVVIKLITGVSDREVVEQIAENPYMQYFIGMEIYRDEPLFAASMMVSFRKRLGDELILEVMRLIGKRPKGLLHQE